MALGTSRTPERQFPLLSGVILPKKTATAQTITTGTTVMTVAQALQGILPINCTDAGTFTVPTAALLVAGIPGCKVGTSFDLDVINYGDATVTFGLGTGVTIVVIAGVDTVLTLQTLYARRFTFICTGVLAEGSSADAFELWSYGETAAAVS